MPIDDKHFLSGQFKFSSSTMKQIKSVGYPRVAHLTWDLMSFLAFLVSIPMLGVSYPGSLSDSWPHPGGGYEIPFNLKHSNFPRRKFKFSKQNWSSNFWILGVIDLQAVVPVNPVTKKGHDWLLGGFIFGTEIGGYQWKKAPCIVLWQNYLINCKWDC